jgi:carboxypeptidase T
MVNTREIWIVTSANPDGSEYDIATGNYRSWRKNRQGPGTDGVAVVGQAARPAARPTVGPRRSRRRKPSGSGDFVNSHVPGGVQQIKSDIDFRTYSELVLWPFGYTTADTGPGLTTTEQWAFSTLGRQMAQTNGYTPEQVSDLYITDGTINDWLWGVHKIWSYTFEMYPRSGNGGFYPPDEVITRETQRNDPAVALFLSYADCVARVIGGTC